MKKLEWHTEKRRLSDLKPYKGNPRQMTKDQFEQLKKSVKKFNLVEIPAINTDNTLIAGNQRKNILKALKREDEEIEVRVPNRKLTPEEVWEYNIRSNLNTGSFDFDILANDNDEGDLLDLGFDKMQLGLMEKVRKEKKPTVCPECGFEF